MPSLFQTRFEARVRSAEDRAFGVTIQLKRDALESDDITAVWHAEEYQSFEHETGLAVVIKRRSYSFVKTAAVLAGDTVTPRAGDYILDGTDELRICAMDGKPAVEEEPGGYRWLVRTDKLA